MNTKLKRNCNNHIIAHCILLYPRAHTCRFSPFPNKLIKPRLNLRILMLSLNPQLPEQLFAIGDSRLTSATVRPISSCPFGSQKKIARIARFTRTPLLRKLTRGTMGRMIYADINTPIAARDALLFFFLLVHQAADTPRQRSQRNRVAPRGKTQYHPVMTTSYFSKVPLRG